MDLDVFFVGTAGSAPTPGRGLPATLVRRGGERMLVDCGEGTQRQLMQSVGLGEIESILITHFHADHVLGLPGVMKTWALHGREEPLTVAGPKGLSKLFGVLKPLIGRLTFELELTELEPGAELARDGYRLAAFEVDHRVPALGYALIEDDRPGRFDEDRARELGVAPGPDFGTLQRGEPVAGGDGQVEPAQVLGEERRGRRLVLAGDSAPSELTKVVAWRADLLVHEATFAEADAERARETGHATARGAAQLAKDAEVELLALTHLSPRYPARELREEARAVFERTVVPRDFDRVEIPFPERGPPVHHRGEAVVGSPTA